MKSKALLLMLALVATPALADNILSRAVDFGRELLDETRKLAPGIQQDHSAVPSRQASAHPDDGRDAPALDTGVASAGNRTTTAGPTAVVGSGQPAAPAAPQNNQGWFVEEDHLK
ncbi:hypothetical protein Q9290_10130 [Oceanimonas sp. CHS3-5]|uniref:hypothetical protein n=1 Tax=Oceanimonas sp. CHS3-5 TaxID=3068186 RepID=UPI00273FFB3A|nr:hypothetical protein [Oceanimonas sp. CHS3-5]MDP5292642.1 hypothetical protein [Oceanimonas sp. CHS3-5]